MFAAKIAHRCNEEALFKSKQLCGFQIIKNATEEEEKCLSQSKSLCEEAISVLTVPSAGHRISLRKSSKPLGWFITQLGLSASPVSLACSSHQLLLKEMPATIYHRSDQGTYFALTAGQEATCQRVQTVGFLRLGC